MCSFNDIDMEKVMEDMEIEIEQIINNIWNFENRPS